MRAAAQISSTFFTVLGIKGALLERQRNASDCYFLLPVVIFNHNPTHKKYILYDFRVLRQSLRSSKFSSQQRDTSSNGLLDRVAEPLRHPHVSRCLGLSREIPICIAMA